MSLESAAVAVAVPVLISVANKLLTKQPITRDDFAAINEALAPFVTAEGAALAEAAVEAGQDTVYGPRT